MPQHARKLPVHDSPVVLRASVLSRASGWPVARLLFGQRLSGCPRFWLLREQIADMGMKGAS